MPDRLHALIHAMSPAEKRQFSVHHGARAPVSQALFEALSAEPEYRESAFLEKHKKAVFHNHYRAHKHALYQMLLRSLRDHPAPRKGFRHLLEAAMDVDMLMRKGLHKQARKLVDRSLKEARLGAYLDLERLFISWDYRLRKGRFFAGPDAGDMDTFFEALARSGERQQRRDRLRQLLVESFQRIEGTGDVRDPAERAQLEEVLHQAEALFAQTTKSDTDPQGPAEKAAMSGEAESHLLLWQIRYHICQGKGDRKGQVSCMDAIGRLVKQHPHLVEEDPDWDIAHRNNHMILLQNLGRFKEAEQIDAELEALRFESAVLNAQQFCALALNRFNRCVRQRDRKALESWMHRVPEAYAQHLNLLSDPLRLIFYYSFGYGAYLMDDLPAAASHLHAYLDQKSQNLRRAMTHSVLMTQAIVHAELGHQRLTASLVQAGLRRLRRDGEGDSPEAWVLELLRKHDPHAGSRSAWFAAIKDLQTRLKNADPAQQRRARVGFDLYAWSAGHLDGHGMWAHLEPY